MNAILYLRFSTDEQADGDSERRQTERAKRWCHENHHTLTRIYADKGVSGGKGSRDRKGLASMLDDLDRGIKPAFLLTEDVDRLSRQLPLEASKLIERILSHDVTIISLRDGQTLTKDNWQTTQVWLIFQLKSSLANEERLKRIDRGRAAWVEKRRQVSSRIYTAKVPIWLRTQDGKIVTVPERVTVIERLFRLASEGVGIITMIRLFNEEGVKSFTPNRDWNKATIYNFLTSRATIGRFQPQTSIPARRADGREFKERIPDGPEIENYFPRIIDDELFFGVQAKLKQRNKYRGTGVKRNPSNNNLFAGIIKCKACGASMIHLVRSKHGYSYLVCSTAHKHKGCSYKVVNTHVLETCFHLFLESENVFKTFRIPVSKTDAIQAQRTGVAKQLGKYLAMIEDMDAPPKSIAQRIAELEAKETKLAAESERAKLEDMRVSTRPELYEEFIETMVENLQTPLGRVKIMSTLKDLVERIDVDPHQRRMWVKWQGVDKAEALEWAKNKGSFWRIDHTGRKTGKAFGIPND